MRRIDGTPQRSGPEYGRGVRATALVTAAASLIAMAAIRPQRFDTRLDTNFSVGNCQRNPDSWAYTGIIDPDIPPGEPRTHTIGLVDRYEDGGRTPIIEDGAEVTHQVDGDVKVKPLQGDVQVFDPEDVTEPVTIPSGSGHEITVFNKPHETVGRILGVVIDCSTDNSYVDRYLDNNTELPRFY